MYTLLIEKVQYMYHASHKCLHKHTDWHSGISLVKHPEDKPHTQAMKRSAICFIRNEGQSFLAAAGPQTIPLGTRLKSPLRPAQSSSGT